MDIFIPQMQLAIEFGAWFWHKDRLSRDNEKQKLCTDKGIKLITILEDCPYEHIDGLIGNYRLLQQEISNEEDYQTTKSIIENICIDYDIPFDNIEKSWKKIVREATNKAQRRDDATFRKELEDINQSVALLEPYTRSNVKILCRCKLCGNKWQARPTSLLRGHACPYCARKLVGQKNTITADMFIDRLASINPDIEALEAYERGNKEIKCRCKVCGNIWSTKPKNLLVGHGCYKCGRLKTVKTQSKPIRCIETGIVYDSIADVFRKTGISNAHKCAKGYQKTAGGYHWEYIETYPD